MKKKKLAIWAVMWLITYPALLADAQHGFNDPDFNRKECRHDEGFVSLMALLPPVWVLAPFLTGFYENGFQFTCEGVSHE